MRKKFPTGGGFKMRSAPPAAPTRGFSGAGLPAVALARRSAQPAVALRALAGKREGGSGLDHLDQLDRLLALLAGAVAHHFFEQLARAVLYAQIDIAARQIQLGCHLRGKRRTRLRPG